ncbi:hypothetical protein [Atlantibacter hermannii]|uniref:hypothetical protein n=1 Tax=Atlantibacter hermannii TaxID=565 RepID=UPI0028A06460|nr:hypothetical protein [Atlantibacter hermannii]
MSVTDINSAQQRHKDREMLMSLNAVIQDNERTHERLVQMRKEIESRLGINPDGPEDAA